MKINNIIQRTCKIFQYNDWEINYEETWGKAVQRVLHSKIPQKISSLDEELRFTVFDGVKIDEIIIKHKNMEKRAEEFCKGMMTYLDENAQFYHIIDKMREKCNDSLQSSL